MTVLQRREAVGVFLVFAFAYFLSALIRAITATLSPVLTQEFGLGASDLGLLAGGYFLGFSATQLPLGAWLDRHGPKRVIICFLVFAVVGCLAFSLATNFTGLLAARLLCGVGVSACLMAPLTGYRRWFAPALQMRSNSWMLMSGSLGMVASTLPVQWLTPSVGWRPLFGGLAALLLVGMALIARLVPAWGRQKTVAHGFPIAQASYGQVWRNPYFRRMVPIGFFCYGGLLAVQTLWAGPWMITMAGYTPLQAATGLFWINVAMLFTFWSWGMVSPLLARRGLHADYLITRGLPASFVLLAAIIVTTEDFPRWSGTLLALYCMACSFVTLSQPSIGMAFGPDTAGRALSAYNLVIFVGVFVIQWGIGLLVDAMVVLGLPRPLAFQLSFSGLLVCCIGSYVYFLCAAGHNRRP